jgi:regulation of enolase protein 1 (concanavalin A-like superfamily)
MKTLFPIMTAVMACLPLVPASAQQAITIAPKHRYRFDNTAGTLAAGMQLADSIGTAHGYIRGTGASATGTGVRLTGGSSATAAYIDLPNASVSGSAEIFPGFSETSYELWVTVHTTQNWARILDFGNNSIDEVTAPGGSFAGADYLMISASIGTANDIRFERGGQNLVGGGTQDAAGATTIGVRMHLVATYEAASSSWKLYKNGVQIASVPTLLGPGTLDDLNVWLGRSNWSGDANADATFDETRIYDYALNPQQVLGNYQAGPDILPSDSPLNQAPSFASNPLNKTSGIVGTAYSGSLSDDASDPDAGAVLTFGKTAGPSWLTVAPNGTLGGTPATGTVGVNAFTVRVTDEGGLYSETTLNITVNNAMPAGWSSGDIGAVGIAGGASESHLAPGIYTVTGSGTDIFGTADAFQYTSRTLSGDGEIRARITSQTNTDPWAKAGVMIRSSSAAGSAHAMMVLTPGNGFSFQYRATASGASNMVAGTASNPAPNNWVRLTRSGTRFTGYASVDGVTWIQQGTATVSLSGAVSVGMAVTSHNNSATSSAVFDNVTITPYPLPWVSADIGTTGLQGSAEFYGTSHTLKGAGIFGGTSDGFRYVYQTMTADGSIIARVNTLQNTGTGARVGVMIRDSLASNSRMAALSVNGSGGWRWDRRTTTGGNLTTTSSSSGTAPNLWVRLVRSGNSISAYRSTNGTSWTLITTSTVTMASNCYIGIAVASGSATTLNTSVLNSLTVVP